MPSISRLFEKFASKSYQGTGLGLYICKGIIEDIHGGRIWEEIILVGTVLRSLLTANH